MPEAKTYDWTAVWTHMYDTAPEGKTLEVVKLFERCMLYAYEEGYRDCLNESARQIAV